MTTHPTDATAQRIADYDALDDFTRGYVDCALWLFDAKPGSGEWDDAESFVERIERATWQEMLDDCADFRELVTTRQEEEGKPALTWPDDASAGHDFYLSRNGHGAGFFDRDYPDCDALQRWAKTYGTWELDSGEDEGDYDKENGIDLGKPIYRQN